MKTIWAISYRGKMDEIFITATGNENEVKKTHYDNNGNVKKEKVYNVTDRKLINRRARDIQDYYYNLVENNGYVAHYE